MKKIISLCCLIQLLFGNAEAQKNNNIKYSKLFKYHYFTYWSYSVGLGTAAYHGDLCGRPECNSYLPAASLGLNYKIWPHTYLGAELNYFRLQAIAHHKSSASDVKFTSQNFDFKLFGRYNLLEDKYRTVSDRSNFKRFNLYGQVGIGMVYFNPSSTLLLTGERPAKIQKQSYPAYALIVPFSLGVSYAFSRKLMLIAEGTLCLTGTDYLDDYGGTYGNPNKRNDSYGLALLKLQLTPGVPQDKKRKTAGGKNKLKSNPPPRRTSNRKPAGRRPPERR